MHTHAWAHGCCDAPRAAQPVAPHTPEGPDPLAVFPSKRWWWHNGPVRAARALGSAGPAVGRASRPPSPAAAMPIADLLETPPVSG
eukprot:351641-Chlamydomonas_euryale.AAC.6